MKKKMRTTKNKDDLIFKLEIRHKVGEYYVDLMHLPAEIKSQQDETIILLERVLFKLKANRNNFIYNKNYVSYYKALEDGTVGDTIRIKVV